MIFKGKHREAANLLSKILGENIKPFLRKAILTRLLFLEEELLRPIRWLDMKQRLIFIRSDRVIERESWA